MNTRLLPLLLLLRVPNSKPFSDSLLGAWVAAEFVRVQLLVGYQITPRGANALFCSMSHGGKPGLVFWD
jgi:hypothetical protein